MEDEDSLAVLGLVVGSGLFWGDLELEGGEGGYAHVYDTGHCLRGSCQYITPMQYKHLQGLERMPKQLMILRIKQPRYNLKHQKLILSNPPRLINKRCHQQKHILLIIKLSLSINKLQ